MMQTRGCYVRLPALQLQFSDYDKPALRGTRPAAITGTTWCVWTAGRSFLYAWSGCTSSEQRPGAELRQKALGARHETAARSFNLARAATKVAVWLFSLASHRIRI